MIKVNNQNRYVVLDALRFIAAIAVVFYHYSIFYSSSNIIINTISKYGYLGVNFFFLLSGFVIMASAQNRSPFEFAFARANRIYPAFIICLIFTVCTLTFIKGHSFDSKQLILNALILNDYFDVENIDGVYWTLQAELKFYACIFLLMLTGVFSFWRYWLSFWLLLAVIHYFWGQPTFMGWFINPGYSFYFIGGVSAYLLSKFPKDVSVHLIFMISLIFGFLAAQQQTSDFLKAVGSKEEIIAGGIVIIFYGFFYCLIKGFFKIPESRLILTLGAISYPIYLTHNMAGKAIIEFFTGRVDVPILLLCVILFIMLFSFFVCLAERKIWSVIQLLKLSIQKYKS